jgi:REP element-mobilizing transposase RayT
LRGNHRQAIFDSDQDRLLLNSIVAHALERHEARLHAYCWMTNHLHLMLQVGHEPLAGVMRHIASGYARAYQKKLETTGHLFERRYHALLVDADSYLLELLRYIHFNPVTAKLVAKPHEFRWSSHHAYLGVAVDPWVTTEFALRMFADSPDRARARYCEFLNCDVQTLKSPLDEARGEGGQFLGSDDFIQRVSPPAKRITELTLAAIIEAACAEFGISRARLGTLARSELIARVRARVASRALELGVASLSEVAREVGCDRKTLRDAMRRYEDKVK